MLCHVCLHPPPITTGPGPRGVAPSMILDLSFHVKVLIKLFIASYVSQLSADIEMKN